MPTNDCLTYLQTLLAMDVDAHRYRSGKKVSQPPPLVITISRDYGAGGELLGRSLSQCLGIPIYDREILRLIAERSKSTEFHVELQDEAVTSGLTSFIFSTITGTTSHMAVYRRVLYDVVMDLSKHDAILIGRGAHLILGTRKVFRIRVIASPETCAERVAAEEAISAAEAERKVKQTNEQRHQSIQRLFSDHYKQCSLENAHNFDLVLNTDQIPPDQAAPVILMGLRQAGFDLYQERKAV